MRIEIKEVTPENLNEILGLHVKSTQTSFIETTAQCLEDAKRHHAYRPAGLYRDGELVGFAMYGLFPREGVNGRVWLDRFLIDARYQGQGLGSILLEALISHLIGLYGCKEIFLSLYPDNVHALYLYEKFGFTFNGEFDVNKERVMVKVIE